MASFKDGESLLTECPVCHEELKHPKLLPCSHSYCLDCIIKHAAQKRTFLCPECRAETIIPERGAEAFPDNRYVEDMIRLIKTMQIGDMCQKHKQHLVLFCDNKDCQEQICPACVFVQHKDHKIVDLSSKAGEVRDKMADRKNKAREISLLLGKYLAELNNIEKKVNADTSENQDEVDKAKELLHQCIKELHQQVQEKTEAHKLELFKLQKANLSQLKETKEKIQNCKAQLDSFYVEVDKSINHLSDNALVHNDGNVEKVFKDLSEREIIGKNFDVRVKEVKYNQPDLMAQLKFQDAGTIRDTGEAVGSIKSKVRDITRTLFPLPEIKQINCKLVKSINTGGLRGMCVSKDGSVFITEYRDKSHWLKRLKNGECLWEVKLDGNPGDGLCCATGNKEYLINHIGKRLEVREITYGNVMHKCDVDFNPSYMCSTDDGSVLVANDSVNPRTLVKFELNEQEAVTLTRTNETINTQLTYVEGLNLISHFDTKLVIVTQRRIQHFPLERAPLALWPLEAYIKMIESVAGLRPLSDPPMQVVGSKTIEAIDYQTREIVWKITLEQIDGKMIKPNGVCHDDVGHLYVADWTNNRVFVASVADGKIKQKLVDLPGTTRFTAFDALQQKLVVGYADVVNIYDIEYVPA